MKWIILEGADGTGKTTLAKQIIANSILGGEVLIFNYRYPEEMSKEMNLAYARGEYEASLRIFKQLLESNNIICDRFHLGEFTYGQVKREYRRTEAFETLSRIEWLIIKQLGWDYLKNHFSLIVLTGGQWDILSRACGTTQYPTRSDQKEIIELYEQAYHISILPKIQINTTDNDIASTTKKALDFIFRDERP